MDEPMNQCDECGQRFFYDPKYHECAHKGDPALLAHAEQVRGESWADECVRRVMT